ncbi:hypothetical protein NKH77_56205 [Streptomyces sp. M19]
MAWGLQGGRATLMRVFKALKRNKTYPHLIRLFEAAPQIPGFTPEEDAVFKTVYADALHAAEGLLAGDDGSDDDEEGGGKGRKRKKAAPRSPPTPTRRPRLPCATRSWAPWPTARPAAPARSAARSVSAPGRPGRGKRGQHPLKLASEGRVAKAGHGSWVLLPSS